MTYKHRACQL